MIAGPRTVLSSEHCAVLEHDAPVDPRRSRHLAVDAAVEGLEHPGVRLEQRILLAGVEPPALEDLVADGVAAVDEPLDGIGDLELAARGRFDGGDGLVDGGGEQVDADEGEVRRRVDRLLDEADDAALRASTSATPKRWGSGTLQSRIFATGAATWPSSVGVSAAAAPSSNRVDEAGRGAAGACCRRGT